MLLRRRPALRGHVARLAVVSLVGFGLVALPGAASADPHSGTAKSSGKHAVCLPRTPVNDLHLPVDLPTCLPGQKALVPSADHTAEPTTDPSGGDTADPTDPAGPGKLCVPLPEDLLHQLPAEIPTCLPKCLSDGVLRTLKNLPRDTLNELLGDIVKTLGELPDCLLSLLPKPSQPPATHPPHHHHPRPTPSPTHSHKPKPHPTRTVHVTYTAGPAKPIRGNPDFTG